MSKKHFYHDIIEIDSVFVELDNFDFSDDEKQYLGRLVDANLHHTILDAILSELNEADKKQFLNHLQKDEQTEIWELLNNRVEKIEDKIKQAAEEVKKELHEDIKEAKEVKES
jgi:Mg/Co/Ni transporter MgtE